MSILSLFPIYNSFEEGFELAGFDISTRCQNPIGVIGPLNYKLKRTIKSLTPLFFVAVSTRSHNIDIDDGYVAYTYCSFAEEYGCSRNILWTIGIKTTDISTYIDFPEPVLTDTYNDIHPDTALALDIAIAVTDAVDKMVVFNDYDKFYVFSDFNG